MSDEFNMKDQQKIKGYRKLSDKEIELINEIKLVGLELKKICEELENHNVDTLWLEVGETHLKLGMMSITRSIAKPEGF